VFRHGQYHGQVDASAIGQRARIHVQPDGHASMLCELTEVLPLATTNVNYDAFRRKPILYKGGTRRNKAELCRTSRETAGHAPIFRGGTRQTQDSRS
jgi:hypothetical protein